MKTAGRWTLALGLATGAILAFTLTTRTGKKVRSDVSKRITTTKPGIKARALANDDSEIHYV